jgi:ABC-type Mn2+/Zn2+ transport system permease subunit
LILRFVKNDSHSLENLKLDMNLLESLTLGFMQRGMAIGLLLALICGLLGCFVVLRNMEYIGDAISHSVLPGVVVAYITRGNILVGGLIAGLLTASAIAWFGRNSRLRESTTIGVAFTGALALGVVLISATRSYTRDLSHFLFGNILAITDGDLFFTALVATVVLLTLGATHKELALASFDPIYAKKIGIPVDGLRTLMLVLLTLSVVAGISSAGTLMVTSLLITPAATASLLTSRLSSMMALATFLAACAVMLGLFASYALDVAPGAMIVLSATAFFVISIVGTRITKKYKH